MRRFWLVLATAIIGLAETRYEIDLAKAGARTLVISLEAECARAECDFQMPVWNATYQIRDFAQYVTKFEATRPDGEPLEHRMLTHSSWRVKVAPGERVRLRYQVVADRPGPFGCSASMQHVFLNFAQVLVYPVDRLREPARVRFRNVPASWRTALELPEGNGWFHARNYDELVDAPAELSAFAASEFSVAGRRLRVVADGNPNDYDLPRVAETARKIASAAVEIMADVPFPSYTFIYHFRNGGRGGMEHANSTAIDSHAPCRQCDLSSVTAHEFFHLWNVKRIRPRSLEPIDYTRENITPSLWFSEGVTSTYASYILLQGGLEDARDFLQGLASQITAYEQAPARLAQSLEEASIAAWLERYPFYTRPSRSISYYQKGELAGYLLDLAIRRRSGNRRSLDDVMRRLNQDYAQHGRYFEDSEALERLAAEAAGAEMQEVFDQVVRRAAPMDWDQYLGYAGYRVKRQITMTSWLGVEVSNAPGRGVLIAEVEANGPAEKAGLQPGDRLLSVNGEPAGRKVWAALEAAGKEAVRLEIERGGERLAVRVTPEKKPRMSYSIEDRLDAGPLEKAIRAGWLRTKRGQNVFTSAPQTGADGRHSPNL